MGQREEAPGTACFPEASSLSLPLTFLRNNLLLENYPHPHFKALTIILGPTEPESNMVALSGYLWEEKSSLEPAHLSPNPHKKHLDLWFSKDLWR